VSILLTWGHFCISLLYRSGDAFVDHYPDRFRFDFNLASNLWDICILALETVGPANELAVQFLNDLGDRITSVSADDKEGQFLFQRFNAIVLHCTSRLGVTTTLEPSSFFNLLSF